MVKNTKDNDSSALSSFVSVLGTFGKLTFTMIKYSILPIIWAFKILNMFFSVFKIILLLLLVAGILSLSGGSLGGGNIASLVQNMIEMLTQTGV